MDAYRLIAPFLPWTDGTGRPWRGWWLLPAAPFLLLYLAVAWALFLPLAQEQNGGYGIDKERLDRFLYHIPDLTENPPRVLLALVTAPFLNHNDVQLVYITVLLLLFGLIFEAREGTARTLLLFFSTTFAGALGAGFLLHLLYPNLIDNEFLARAWGRTWSGGSAAAFGLMGALAARARRPWPLLGLFMLWELGVVIVYLKEYTPAFHLTALFTGFLITRLTLPPVPRDAAAAR